MPKLNNLSRQHLSERPVMGDEDRWKENVSDEGVSGGQEERKNDGGENNSGQHAHTQTGTAVT